MFKVKIFAFLSLSLLIWGCGSSQPEQNLWTTDLKSEQSIQPIQPVRAAMLLPLTGKASAMGTAFQQAGMMALFERPDSPLELLFFDTAGTAQGTQKAWEEAKEQSPDIIIGPIFSEEVKALKKSDPDVPVISFTSDSSLMNSDVYTMGVLIPDQITRLIQFACTNGQRRLAVLGPENQAGEMTMNALSETIERCPGMTLTKVSLYPSATVNFDPAIRKIVPEPIDPQKKDLTEEEKELLATPMSERVEFDALFIFEDGIKLRQLASLLAFYDVTPDVVPFYGLANWQETRDTNLKGGYYPAVDNRRAHQFSVRYNRTFGSAPPRISSLAYDTVSLVAILAERRALTQANLTNPLGYNGVDGRFRLHTDGTNERLLKMYQIGPKMRRIVVGEAPEEFPDPKALFADPIPEEVLEDIGIETSEIPSLPPILSATLQTHTNDIKMY